jgi:hypothetical protein
MTSDEEIQYYRNILEEGLQLISTALGVGCEHYDTDQADGECYLDCFRDAAGIINLSGYKWDDEEAEFLIESMTSEKLNKQELAEVEVVGWQFYQDGKWHMGMDTGNHRQNTEESGYPVRDIYAPKVAIQSAAEKYRDEQIELLISTLPPDMPPHEAFEIAEYQFEHGVRVVDKSKGEFVARKLSHEQREAIRLELRVSDSWTSKLERAMNVEGE